MWREAIYLCLFTIFLTNAENSTSPHEDPNESETETNSTIPLIKIIDTSNTDVESTTIEIKEDIDVITEPYKEEPEKKTQSKESNIQRSKKNTRSLETSSASSDLASKRNEPGLLLPDPNQDVEDIVEALLNKPNLTFRSDHSRKSNVEKAGRAGNEQSPEPNYIEQFTGNLVIPILKARQTLGKAMVKTNEGIQEIGSGTYEAASGAFSFVRDAASAVFMG